MHEEDKIMLCVGIIAFLSGWVGFMLGWFVGKFG